MKSHNGIIVERDEIEHEVVLKPLHIPKFDHNYETSPIQKVDLSLLRRFDIACGEVKYFKPEMIISKNCSPTLESSLKPKSISPKCCTCIRSHDKNSENWRWLEEFRREQLQLTTKSIVWVEENIDQQTLLNSEGKNTPTTFVVENVIDTPFVKEYHGQKVSTLDACIEEGSSFSKMDERSNMDDDSSNYSTSLDSSTLCTLIGKLQDKPTLSLIPENNLIENFSNSIELHEEKSAKTSVLVAMNSRRKNQQLSDNESHGNSSTPKSLEMSNNQLSVLVDDEEANVVEDVNERRKSLICAAKAINLPKLKWTDLSLEDLDDIHVVSKNESIDTKCAMLFEDVKLDAQEISPLDIEQEIQGFDSLRNGKEQRSVISPKQQSKFLQYVVPHSNLQREVDVLAIKLSIYKDYKDNGSENFYGKSSEESRLKAHNIVVQSTCESQRTSGLALLVMGDVDFCLSPIADEMNNVEVKNLSELVDSVGKLFYIHNERYLEHICRAIEFSSMKQLKKYQNLAPRDFVRASLKNVAFVEALDNKTQGFSKDVSIAKISQCNKHNSKEELGNKDVLNSNDAAIVPTIVEASRDDFKIGNTGVEKAREGKGWFQQRLWCYLFENMKRAIDELYSLCELELDVQQIKQALLVLDEAGFDFKDLKAKVDNFNQVNKVLDLHQPSFVVSTEGDLQQRQLQAVASEVCHMACSNEEQVSIISLSLEAFKKVHGSPQSSSPQDRQQGDIFENLLFEGPTCAQIVVSPKQTKESREKPSSINNSELLTKKSIELSSKILASNSSSINRFMNPTASSEQRVSSRERQNLNVPISSKSVLEAWKEKQNSEDILSSPLSSSSRISKSLEIGQRCTKQVHMPYKEFALSKQKKVNLIETKKVVNQKQDYTTSMSMELENERVQQLQKASKELIRVSDWQVVKNNKLQRDTHSQQQSRESQHKAHLVHISRRTSEERRKVHEVFFITSLHKKNKKLFLQQKIQDSKNRRIGRLQTIRLKQKEDILKREDAQKKKHHLEAEKLQRIAKVQQRNDGTKIRQEEERKNVIATQETQAIEYIWKKEPWAKAHQEKNELLRKNLSEGLRKNSLQQKMNLEQIKECTMMDFDKQENNNREILRESSIKTQDQGSACYRQTSLGREKIFSNQLLESDMDIYVPLDKSTSGGSEPSSAGLISLVGHHNNTSLQAFKKRI